MTGIKNRKFSVLLIVALLVALNIWRWWPVTKVSAREAVTPSTTFRLEDFEVRALPADSLDPMHRDLFHPKIAPVTKPHVKVVPNITQAPPVKSPEELAHDAAQAEFAQIRCVGISVRDKRIQAYILNRGDPFLVTTGDKVGSRFVVEKILFDGVVLQDPVTGVGGQIAVSGK